MQSIKNTGVTVMLLFLSYGVYQVIMKPMPESEGQETISFNVSDPLSDSGSDLKDAGSANPALQIHARQTQPLKLDFGGTPENQSAMNLPRQNDNFSDDFSDDFNSRTAADFEPPQKTQPPLSIPKQLLELPDELDRQIAQNEQFNADSNFDEAPRYQLDDPAPNSQAANDQQMHDQSSVDFQPGSQLPPVNQLATGDEPVSLPENDQFAGQSDFDADPINDTNQFASTPLPPQQNVEPQTTEPLLSDTAVVPTGAMTSVAPRENSPTAEPGVAPPPALANSWSRIESLVKTGEYKAALSDLSQYYRNRDLEPIQRQRMLEWLDALAAKVIYSTEHHLRSLPYVIQPDDTIATLARDWQVPAQLIYNINTDRIPDPNDLRPGTEIKLIQGPFDAEIDADSNVMTLFLDNMYAGRFGIGSHSQLNAGEFRIIDKSANDESGRRYWIELNNGLAIFGSEQGTTDQNEIAMNPGEAEELFSILSATSNVKVIR